MRFSNSAFLALALGLICLVAPTQGIIASEANPIGTAGERPLLERLNSLLELDPEEDLLEIGTAADALYQTASQTADARKMAKRAKKADLPDLPQSELREYFHDPSSLLSSREIRALQEIARVTNAALAAPAERRASALMILRELLVALENNRRSPIPASVGALTPWKLWLQNHNRSIGRGVSSATNLSCDDSVNLSLCDPKPSGFWQRPPTIATQDLGTGFGRTVLPNFTNTVWTYDKPKTSSGTRPGFNVKNAGVELKVKLAEVSSEPFTARIFHALGYHVDPTDHVPALKVHYSRRLLREFNLRKPLVLPLRPLWVPAGSLQLQPQYDPFQFITWAVFKDGKRITGFELRKQLLIDSSGAQPEEDPANYRIDVEANLDHLEICPANIQSEESVGDAVGSWDFVGLGHENLRELRGAGLLAAWLGWFDSRFDNTRLRVVETDGQSELRYFFTDLGAGMGSGNGWLVRHGENVDAMEPTFTSPRIVRGRGRMTTPFQVHHFQTIVPTPAFQEMTFEDAHWMARLIGQLTVRQLRDALSASGYHAADAELYLAKLLSRRNRMIFDLELANEFPPINP